MVKQSELRKSVKDIFLRENAEIQIEDDEDFQANFSDIGIDSLDLMMATLKITEIYGVQFTDETFDKIENIQDILDFIEENT